MVRTRSVVNVELWVDDWISDKWWNCVPMNQIEKEMETENESALMAWHQTKPNPFQYRWPSKKPESRDRSPIPPRYIFFLGREFIIFKQSTPWNTPPINVYLKKLKSLFQRVFLSDKQRQIDGLSHFSRCFSKVFLCDYNPLSEFLRVHFS